MCAAKNDKKPMAWKNIAKKDFQWGLENFVSKDPKIREQAFKLIHQAGEAGLHDAQVWLGAAYGNGIVLPKDDEKSLYWNDLAFGH